MRAWGDKFGIDAHGFVHRRLHIDDARRLSQHRPGDDGAADPAHPACAAINPGQQPALGGDGDAGGERGHHHRSWVYLRVHRQRSDVHRGWESTCGAASEQACEGPAMTFGRGCAGAGNGERDAGLRGEPEPCESGGRDGRLRDLERERDGGPGLHGGVGDADLRGGRDGLRRSCNESAFVLITYCGRGITNEIQSNEYTIIISI